MNNEGITLAKVTYIASDGTEISVEAEDGVSLMVTALLNGIDGIIGECGGSAMCATCHVYVDEAFVEALPAPSDVETEMLACTASERRPNSRLACQISAGPALEGLVVHIPASQA